MTSDFGILSYGICIPRMRIKREAIFSANSWFAPGLRSLAKGERTAANWDEDSITMGVEAARNALAGFDRQNIGTLSLSSTTLPFMDRLNSGIIKEALNLPDHISAADSTGSLRAGSTAVLQALNSRSTKPYLCVAAEHRKARPASEAELVQGDGAAAVLIGQGPVIAKFRGSYSRTVDFVDHFRAYGNQFDYHWESRWVRDEGHMRIACDGLKAALSKMGIVPSDVSRVIIPISVRGVPELIAKAAGISADAVAVDHAAVVGDIGCAQPLLMLAAGLEQANPGDTIILLGFGQGVDVIALEVTDAIRNHQKLGSVAHALANKVETSNYMRFLFHRGHVELDRGMRAEIDQKQPGSTLYRNKKAVMSLIGGRCVKTGAVQFPKTDVVVGSQLEQDNAQEDYPLADKTAKIVTYTSDSLTYSPDPPSSYGMIDFDGGGRMIAEFTDVDPSELNVGREMRMVFRIKTVDEARGFTRYFWKATPTRKGS